MGGSRLDRATVLTQQMGLERDESRVVIEYAREKCFVFVFRYEEWPGPRPMVFVR